MFCTIINDCLDGDAVGRQCTRVSSLLGVTPTFVGVGGSLRFDNTHDPAEIEAAGCLVDVLDAAEGKKGLVLVNSANRHSKGKKWPNGTPFGFFRYGETIVVSTIDGYVLSLVKKLGILCSLQVFDVPEVMAYLAKQGAVSQFVAEHVSHTQFRSFDFSPRIGSYLIQGGTAPSQAYTLDEIEVLPDVVWFIDNFGNVKTSLLPEEVNFSADTVLHTQWGDFTCYNHLKDVPNGEKGCMIGSSGIEGKRFLELTIQGKNVAEELRISVGDFLSRG